jgi:hypothetical protein
MDKNIIDFLNELSDLTERHKIVIDSCGCCGSPFLIPLGQRATDCAIIAQYVRFDEKTKKYTFR